jgi:hypothetical protein
MSDKIYKKLKRQNGEAFARTVRDHHNGLLEISNLLHIVRYAGDSAQDAEDILPYLMSVLTAQIENKDTTPPSTPRDPFELLDEAGYDAFHADSLEKQNSIAHFFKKSELLCTFNDAARYKRYHIVHAIKKDVDQIKRADFIGKEDRQDEYGTSVISIQIGKGERFISIKNRYNHTVAGCDHTFNSNPDNIINGLSDALKNHFNVEFTALNAPLANDFALFNDQIAKYHRETENYYYGDQFWALDGVLHPIDRGRGDALFEGFIFDNKSKTLQKIDPTNTDSFAESFNRVYGGRAGLKTDASGNLTLDGKILITAEKSRITAIDLPELEVMDNYCLHDTHEITKINVPHLKKMGRDCLHDASRLKIFHADELQIMGDNCLTHIPHLKKLHIPKLRETGELCFAFSESLSTFNAPSLITMGPKNLANTPNIKKFSAANLISAGEHSMYDFDSVTSFHAPALEHLAKSCLTHISSLTKLDLPALRIMEDHCMSNANKLVRIKVPALREMHNWCLENVQSLEVFDARKLEKMENWCLDDARALEVFNAPKVKTIGNWCLSDTPFLSVFRAAELEIMGSSCLGRAQNLKKSEAPKLHMGLEHFLPKWPYKRGALRRPY